MAKKYEFRPDRQRSTLLSYLYLTPKQQKTMLKWVFYAILLVVLSVVQDVLLSPVRVLGATTELVPCAIFLICIIEGLNSGSIFALAAALFYLFSGTAPGAYSMVAITFLSVGICMFRQTYLQESFSSAMLCVAAAMVLYELVNFVFGLFLGLTPLSRFHGFLITAVLTLLSVPVLYPLMKGINAFGGRSWKE